jgi:extradiol dioxygenase family protein
MDTKFHLAFKVKNIENTIKFYHTILECKLGRQTEHWIDFDFFGHQLSAHVSDKIPELDYCGKVENLKVPIPHFGCIVDNYTFNHIKDRLEKYNIDFFLKPQKRYKDQKGEQQTMFILDFSNNPLEFKTFENNEDIFR